MVDYAEDYRNSDPHATHHGKYDSAFHAWLVERCESDDYAGDTDFGGAVLYGRFIDWWTSTGFHTLERFDTRDAAREAYEAWAEEFYADQPDEF